MEASVEEGSHKSLNFPSFFKRLYQDPYGTIDQLDLKFLGRQFNIMKDDQKLLKSMRFPFIAFPIIAWVSIAVVMCLTTPYNGFDANLNQLSYPLTALVQGQGWDGMVFHFYDQYGKGTHWTAFLIYFGFFFYLSKHFRKLGLVNSINISFTTCFTAMAIAIFEYSWMFSYCSSQNQWWILSFIAPQTMITIQNLVFSMLGVLRIGNINWKVLKPRFNKWTWIFLSITIGLFLLWGSYGYILPVQQLTVKTSLGTWTSSKMFPQTLYTVALSPENQTYSNPIAVWAHNDLIHLVNVLTKVFLTLTLLNIFLLKERNHA